LADNPGLEAKTPLALGWGPEHLQRWAGDRNAFVVGLGNGTPSVLGWGQDTVGPDGHSAVDRPALVYELYGLTDDEIKIVEEATCR